MADISFCQLQTAGYANIAQLLLNKGNDMNIVKRMLESVDEKGDTVSLLLLNNTIHIIFSKKHCSLFFMETLLKQRLLFFHFHLLLNNSFLFFQLHPSTQPARIKLFFSYTLSCIFANQHFIFHSLFIMQLGQNM